MGVQVFLGKTAIHPGNRVEHDEVDYSLFTTAKEKENQVYFTMHVLSHVSGVISMPANTAGHVTQNIYCKEDNKKKCKSFPSISKTLVMTDFLIYSESIIPEELEDSSV